MAHHSREQLFSRAAPRGRRRHRKGAVIVLMAIFLVFMIALLALTVDLGYVFMLRTQVQSVVDVSAMAGAGALGDGQTAAQEAALDFAQRNLVGQQQLEAEELTIELGSWDETTRQFSPGGDSPDACRVLGQAGSRALFFGKALALDSTSVSARAVAVHQPRDIMVVLDYSASMNDDSELRHISALGRAAVEANLLQIYQELGSPTFGNMQWQPVYISSSSTSRVMRQLGLDRVAYPYPSGTWSDYVKYCQTSTYIKRAGYHKKYGYLTLVNYWLEKRPKFSQTPDLWQTSEQPITAVKDAVSVLLAYIQEVQADDRVGLSVYTSSNSQAKLETGLTRNMQLVEDISRERQAGHYHTMTNIGAGLQSARLEMKENARRGALKMIVLMTDGKANLPYGNANGYLLDEAQFCADEGYPVITVSLGAGADTALMQQVADVTAGMHFNIPGGQTVAEYEEQLRDVFRKIAAHRPVVLVQ